MNELADLTNDENRVLVEEQDKKIHQLEEYIDIEGKATNREKKKNLKTIKNQTLVIKDLKEKTQTIDSNEIGYLQDQLKKQTKINKQLKQETTKTLALEAPYVHVKITKILGGKGKKGEISISAGGSIEKINDDDVRTFSESMIRIINEKIDYALQELQSEETE